MTLILPGIMYATGGIMFGGAKPVPVNFHRLRHPWRDMSLVALAGPISNMLLAVLFMAAFKFFLTTGLYNGAAATIRGRADDLLPRVLGNTVTFNVLIAVFNMVPIPPLDGSRVMAWLLPAGLREHYVALERFGLIIVFALLAWSNTFSTWLYQSMNAVIELIYRIVPIGNV